MVWLPAVTVPSVLKEKFSSNKYLKVRLVDAILMFSD